MIEREGSNLFGTLEGLVGWVFDSLSSNYQDPAWIASRSVICPTNKTVDIINGAVMNTFPGNAREYRSFDSIEKDAHLYPTEFLNSLSPSGMPPHKMDLKVGCPVMLLRNLDPQHGHCNGTKYVVTHLHDNVIEAVVAVGAYRGNRLFVPRIPIKPSDKSFPFELTRKQFPIRPCFVITSYKAQGQTLSRVGIYIDSHFFSHGQYYVAQSRVGDDSSLKVLVVAREVNGVVYTDNVVYHEVLVCR